MLQAQPITKKSKDLSVIKDLYWSAFLESEQAPMWFLLRRAKRNSVDFFTYYDNDDFVGFSHTITHGSLTFILYIAVCEKSRSKEYGTQILRCIQERYPNNRIILNAEAENESAADNEQRKKRKGFYIKNDAVNDLVNNGGYEYLGKDEDGKAKFGNTPIKAKL